MATRKQKADGTVGGNARNPFERRRVTYDRLVRALLVALTCLVASGCTKKSSTESVAKRSERLHVTSGLVAAYDFDEGSGSSATDASGTGNTGTLSGPSWFATGRRGGALSFDGVNDRVTIADANSLDLTSGMTLMAWVKPDADQTDWGTVVMKERGATGLSYALYGTDGDGAPVAYLRRGAQDRTVSSGHHSPRSDRWTHLAATYNGSAFRFYVNGKLQNSASVSGTITTSTGVLDIGGNAPFGEWFHGLIDEVRVYNRGLSESEVTLEMDGVSPGPAPALVAAYGFDEGAGTAAGDASGTSNTGTLSGPTWSASGKHGGALQFDGQDDRVIVADSPSLDVRYGMTLMAWVKPTALSDWRTVILKEHEGVDLGYSLYAANNSSYPSGHMNHDGEGVFVQGVAAIPLDSWSHLAVAYNDLELNLYVDGQLVASQNQDGDIQTTDGALSIGGNSIWGEWFEGLIDDVRIYDNGLTAAQIATDMNTAVGGGSGCGSGCDDGNACNGVETCVNGSCVAGTPVTCTASDQCHDAGTCNTSTGVCSNPAKTNGTSCNDANACTQSDSCQSGTCTGSNPVTCTAQDSCHDAGTCNTASGVCSNPAKANGSACNDATVCNGAETCQSGSCTAGTPPTTNDGNPCSADSCDPVAGITHTPVTAGTSCTNGNACDGAETCNAAATCVAGTPPTVNDGNPCTTDACDPLAGVTHTPVATGTLCLDANTCNGAETCNSSGTCVPGTPPTLDDGNVCTADSCDQTSGVNHEPVAAGTSCSDSNACNGAETCNGSGTCVAGTPAATDDGNPCTTDSCGASTGVSHQALTDVACDDGNVCNGADTCNAGTCVHATSVDDGNPCTVEACDPQTGETTYTPVSEGTACGDLCTGTGECDGSGFCQLTTPGAAIDYDENPCTSDVCDPATGVTMHVPHPAGTFCDPDSNECNGTDTCDAAGECIAGTPPPLDDSNPCTVDECVFVGSIGVFMIDHAPAPSGTVCGDDDTNPCNGVLACDAQASCSVTRGTDDGRVCTVDTCDPIAGILNELLPAGSACDDSNACTGPGSCSASGTCAEGEGIDVDDGNPCTADSCDAALGAVHAPEPASTSCMNDNPCDGEEICDGEGSCLPGAPVAIDDANPCTTDACDSTRGAEHEPTQAGTDCGNAHVCDGSGACVPLPPDPSTVAPPNDLGIPTTVGASTRFLFTGNHPIQTDADPDAIREQSAAVLRGRILSRDGGALGGAVVEVKGHPELGRTLTRADGWYDLAVNGGTKLTLDVRKPGFLPAQRTATVRWQDFTLVEDVALVALDANVTTIDFTDGRTLAESSVVSDEDGERRAAIAFEPGTTAQLIHPDGSVEPLDVMSIRLTEYTVGANGPSAMPGSLPATSHYTYAIDISADEALADGSTVQFDRPAFFYVDNFLDVPAGRRVPTAYYDFTRAAWIGERDGIVLKLLDIENESAVLDVDGSGTPATQELLDDLGISEDELVTIGSRFVPGQSFWRREVRHLSPFDCNWAPQVLAEDAIAPWDDSNVGPHRLPNPDEDRCKEPGCVIDVGAMSLRQSVPIAGTPYSLNYNSRLMQGYEADKTFTIQVTGEDVHPELLRVVLVIEFAGQGERLVFAPAPNIEHTIHWNGLDAYGRPTNGAARAEFRLEYWYPTYYLVPGYYDAPVNAPTFISWAYTNWGITLDEIERAYGMRTVMERPIVATWFEAIGATMPTLSAWDTRGLGLGGWTISAQDVYDPNERAVVAGRGDVRGDTSLVGPTFEILGEQRNETTAGQFCGSQFQCCHGSTGCDDDGEHVSEADVGDIQDVLALPDGSTILASAYPDHMPNAGAFVTVLRRVSPDGRVGTLRTTALESPDFVNGLQFVQGGSQQLIASRSTRLALGPDGSVYVGASAVPSGVVYKLDFLDLDMVRATRVAGAFEDDPLIAGSDVPALNAGLGSSPTCASCMGRVGGLAVTGDGTVYVSTANLAGAGGDKVWQIATNGMAHVVAGTGIAGLSGDGELAALAQLNRPEGLTVTPDGTLYVADSRNSRVRRIGADGIIGTAAGGPSACTDSRCGEGGPAIEAYLPLPNDVIASGDGAFYITALDKAFFVDGNGLIRAVAGTASPPYGITSGPAVDALLGPGASIDLAPDGSLLIENNYRLYRIARQFPGLETSDFVVPSADATRETRFAPNGRHLETLDVRTGASASTLSYDGAGLLQAIADGSGNVTTIEHGGSGHSIRIIGPFGQATEISLDANGFVSTILDPTGAMTQCEYTADGLMTEFTDGRGGREEYVYDDDGRLTAASGPDESSKDFTLVHGSSSRTITRTTGGGRQAAYHYEMMPTGGVSREVTTSGLTTTTVSESGTITVSFPDGRSSQQVLSADPRFGMLAPYFSRVTDSTPSGLSRDLLRQKNFQGVDVGSSETIVLNGRTTSISYDAATKRQTQISPEGRVTTETLDDKGRPVNLAVGDLLPLELAYDSRGRLETVRQGERTTQAAYVTSGAANGYLRAITDASGAALSFTRDAVGRPLAETRSTTTTGFTWDAMSNVLSVTPPDKPAHEMTYTSANLLESYEPPPAGLSASATGYTYDLDRMLRTETRPGGVSIVRTPDSAGRLDTVAIPGGLIDYDYVPSNEPSGAGKVSSIAGPYGVDLSFTYDGSLTTSTTWSGDVTGSVAWQYDNDFQKILETVSGATGTASTALGYDNDLLLTCASPTTCSPPGADALALTRHPQHGMVTNISLGQTNETWTYNDYGELARQTATFNGSPLVDIIYDQGGAERDRLGRIVRKTETILGVTKVYEYRYDALRRLDQVKIDGVVDDEFTYDDNGNRLTAYKLGQGTVTATYDDQDRLLTYGTYTFTYTANGELEAKTNTANGDEWLFRYDALGNLVSVGLPNGEAVEYLIDGMGRRVGKKKNGVLLRQWIYRDELKPVAELDGAGNLVSEFVYGAKANVPEYVIRGGAMYRVMSDHLGSPRRVVNVANSQDVPFSASYSSFGVMTGTGLEWMPFGFAGGLPDTDTGLVRYGARDLEPAIGRWITKDPTGFIDGPNLYVYTRNDPVSFIDRNGQWLTPVGGSLFIGAALFVWGHVWYTEIVETAHRKYPLEHGLDANQRRAGEADAYQHCLASCISGQNLGKGTSAFLGWVNEAYATGQGYQTPRDRLMDDFNNACGRSFATEDDDCSLACAGAINSGLLERLDVPNYPAPW